MRISCSFFSRMSEMSEEGRGEMRNKESVVVATWMGKREKGKNFICNEENFKMGRV